MASTEITLSADNQNYSILINGVTYQMSVTWRAMFWALDIMDAGGSPLVMGIPIITGADLLAQYRHLGLGFSLYVICDVDGQENPTESDLGITSHLYVVTE